MTTVTNLQKNSSGGFFDIAQFDVATFNPWINAAKSSSVITNLTKLNQGEAIFDLSVFDVATFNNWSNLRKTQ